MLNARIQAFFRGLAEGAVRPLAALGVTPNTITIVGLFLNGGVAAVLATGSLRLGGILLLLAGGFDMLDGALARITRQFTTFGAFLDSTLDRYSEAVVVIGLIYTRNLAGDTLAVCLLAAMLTGSFLISYTRARAEGLGLECKVGLLPRPERIIILAIGLLIGILNPVLILLVVLTNLTAIQRILHVWQVTRKRAQKPEAAETHRDREATTAVRSSPP